MSNDMRLDLLEKKVSVMQQEFNSVLQEMQTTVEGLARLTTAGLRGLQAQLDDLRAGRVPPAAIPAPENKKDGGVEL